MMRKIGLGIFFILVFVSLTGCTLDRITAQQTKATGYWEELIGGDSFGQSFVSAYENLYRIDLSTATFSRINSAPVIFSLKGDPKEPTVILSVVLPGPEIQNEQPTQIIFEPIPDSAGKSYYFSLESPEATPGNAITVYANQQDQYTAGSAYQNGAVVDGDLAFTAYSRQSFTLFGILQGMASKAAQEIPFFICYGMLVLAVIIGLFYTFREGS